MLPDPTLTLTIPSLHDGLLLDCRVYHPHQPHQRHHAAIIAHPYAPMGGSYDDPIVSLVGEQLLDLGFFLATFNFRGARGSAGRTSWTARPERDDYSSFIGFMVYYLHHLHSASVPSSPSPILLMGGYSYGAMITSHLFPLPHLLAAFYSPAPSSHAAQIRQRAALAASLPSTPTTVGNLPVLEDLVIPAPAYLLISPLKGLSTRLTTMSIPFFDAWRKGEDGDDRTKKEEAEDAEATLANCPSLAVYGDCDVFVPVGKLRPWAQDLAARQHSQFRHCEIKSAGHFWSEEGVLCRMMDSIDEFVGQLFDDKTL